MPETPDPSFSFETHLAGLNLTSSSSASPSDAAAIDLGSIQSQLTGSSVVDSSRQLAILAAEAADDRKGQDLVILDLSSVAYLSDYFVIVSALSPTQVKAIARAISDNVEEHLHRLPLRTEGMGDGRWVLQDYGDVIIHVFMPQERQFYNLETFWSHGTPVHWQSSAIA
jgi:ribosome-associated protein